MKRFLSILLSALMLLTCLNALAEDMTMTYEEAGMALDFSDIQAKSENYPLLLDYGIVGHDPFVSAIYVGYYGLPRETVEEMNDTMINTDDPEEYDVLNQSLTNIFYVIGVIAVTDAASPEEMNLFPPDAIVNEFGTVGNYHYYFAHPAHEQVDVNAPMGDTGEEGSEPWQNAEAVRADIGMVQSELLKLLQTAELSEPRDSDAEFIGQVIRFESVDLDGNPVSSADLFKDNRITMVNAWGTWCAKCMEEMGYLAELHKRLQEKGCGIVGVEYEPMPLEEVAGAARQVLEDNGVTYPNVIMPEPDPIFDRTESFPSMFFVNSEGVILTYPISGAKVDLYEPTVERLLADETVVTASETAQAASDSGEYRVMVCDGDGNPVKGVVLQLCDDTTCTLQKTGADGVATFAVEAPKAYEVHVAKVPEGYSSSDEIYSTPETFSDLNIVIEKAE